MGRYADSTITFPFDDLSKKDDQIYVTIRNPKTVPLEQLRPADVPDGPDGEPDKDAATEATYGLIAGLVIDWHVYDGNDDDDDAPPLPLPATAEHIKVLPFVIVSKVMDAIKDVVTAPQ